MTKGTKLKFIVRKPRFWPDTKIYFAEYHNWMGTFWSWAYWPASLLAWRFGRVCSEDHNQFFEHLINFLRVTSCWLICEKRREKVDHLSSDALEIKFRETLRRLSSQLWHDSFQACPPKNRNQIWARSNCGNTSNLSRQRCRQEPHHATTPRASFSWAGVQLSVSFDSDWSWQWLTSKQECAPKKNTEPFQHRSRSRLLRIQDKWHISITVCSSNSCSRTKAAYLFHTSEHVKWDLIASQSSTSPTLGQQRLDPCNRTNEYCHKLRQKGTHALQIPNYWQIQAKTATVSSHFWIPRSARPSEVVTWHVLRGSRADKRRSKIQFYIHVSMHPSLQETRSNWNRKYARTQTQNGKTSAIPKRQRNVLCVRRSVAKLVSTSVTPE